MRRFSHHDMKLRTQVAVLCCCSIFVVLAFGIFFFRTMSDILQEKEQIHINNLIDQVLEKLNSSTENTLQYADLIAKNKYTRQALLEEDPAVNYQNVQILSEIVPSFAENNKNVHGVLLLNLHDVFLGVNEKNYSIVRQLEESYPLFSPSEYEEGFTGLLQNANNGNVFYAYVKTVFDTGIGPGYPRKIGTCIILNTPDQLQSIIDQITLTPNSSFMVLDADNGIIVSDSPSKETAAATAEASLSLMRGQETGTLTGTVLGRPCLVQYKTVPQTNWKILSVVPIREINADLNRFSWYCVLFLLFIVVLFLLWRFQMSRSIMEPIQNMVDFMDKGGYHSLHNRLQVKKHNEIGVLADHINVMLDEIDELIRKSIQNQSNLYEMELAKKRAELSALQSQINPHFLYNTLESLKGYGYLLDSRGVVEITTSLSYIMRYCIKGSELVPVKDELTCIRKYLNIISIRFEDRFRFALECSPELEELPIPRFILQPIVENAIYHGLEPKLSGGRLTVRGCREGGELLFQVIDNGRGIPAQTLAGLQDTLRNTDPQNAINTFADRSIGLININNRLCSIYGREYGLLIESAENEGTTVTMRIPIRREGRTASPAAPET